MVIIYIFDLSMNTSRRISTLKWEKLNVSENVTGIQKVPNN